MEIDERNLHEDDEDSEVVAGQQLIRQAIDREASKIRELARQHRLSKVLIAVTAALVIIIAVMYAVSGLADVKDIRINGNDLLSREYVMEATGINDDSLYTFMIPMINEIKGSSSPLIKKLKVTKGKGHTVSIEIQEEDIVGYRYEDRMELILGNGKTVEYSSRYLKNLAALPMFWKIPEEDVVAIAGEMARLDLDMLVRIAEVHDFALSYDANMVKFVMDDGYRVYCSVTGIDMLNQYLEIIRTSTSKYRCILMDKSNNVAILRDCQELEKQYEETRQKDEPAAPQAEEEPAADDTTAG